MSDPYWDYKDKVDYDYILKANMPIRYYVIEDDDKNIHESQKEQIAEDIQKGIESLITDEDYNKEYFEEIALGRVYPGVNEVWDEIEMYFGISLQDAEKEVTLEDLKESILEYMNNLNSNVDYNSSVSGFETEDENIEPKSIAFEPKGKKDTFKIEVIKEHNKIEESLETEYQSLEDRKASDTEFENFLNKIKDTDEYDKYLKKFQDYVAIQNYINRENIMLDKKLVNEGSLSFKKENTLCKLVLNDEGKVEQFINKELVDSSNFSKTTVTKQVEQLLSENYQLIENEEDLNLEDTKQNIEQSIELVDELQTLKDQLNDKIDTLVNESKEFPSTEFTQKELNTTELDLLDLNKELNDDQKTYIITNICSLDELKEGLLFLLELTEFDGTLISLDEYIKQLKDIEEVSNND